MHIIEELVAGLLSGRECLSQVLPKKVPTWMISDVAMMLPNQIDILWFSLVFIWEVQDVKRAHNTFCSGIFLVLWLVYLSLIFGFLIDSLVIICF